MKIRIQGNAVRLRLSQTEVQQLSETGRVESKVQFGLSPAECLNYSLESTKEAEMSATYGDGHIRIFVPNAQAVSWAASDQVGLEHLQRLDTEYSLHILVEKDFKCLTARPGENESDNFPNPALHC